MACDLCGKKGTSLHALMDAYKTKDIQMICPDCTVLVDAHLRKLQRMTSGLVAHWLKEFMRNRINHDNQD